MYYFGPRIVGSNPSGPYSPTASQADLGFYEDLNASLREASV